MTCDLVIVNPNTSKKVYEGLSCDLAAREPPLWGRLIAGYARDRGYDVKIIDAEAEGIPHGEVGWRIMTKYKPQLVCILAYGHQPSASTQQMNGAGSVAQVCRNGDDALPILMVGGHVSALPDRTLDEMEAVNYVCNGEGPLTACELLEYLSGDRALKDVSGLVWRDKDGNIIHNKPAPLLNVDDLHGNVWDLLPMKKYRSHNWQAFGDISPRQPYASIYTSLGCPFKCSFCCIQAPFNPELHGNRYRMRKPADVVQEIYHLRINYGVKTFKIVDEMFVLNERHYTAICQGIIDAGLNDLNIWAYARVDTVKPHTLSLLRKAGIRWLALGIESGSAHVRDGAKKALRNDDIVGVVRQIQEAGIYVIGNYIFGLPDDDMPSMQATLDLAIECNTEFANFYSAMAYPGSALYTEAIAKNIPLPRTWEGFSQHNYETQPLPTEHVDAAGVLGFRDQAFDAYYKSHSYLEMVEQKFGADTVMQVRNMTAHKINRRILETVHAI